jgi:N-acetylneuraminic acid mutarotase
VDDARERARHRADGAEGGALATDGTYLYASIGNKKKNLYRYDVASNSWSAMTNSPQGFNDGSALTAIGTTVYQLQGDNQKGFYKFVPNAGLGTWTKLKDVPAAVKQGAP